MRVATRRVTPCFARERAAGFAPVADVAIGHGDQLDPMPLGRPQRRATARLDLAVIRMRAETDDAQFAVLGRHFDTVNIHGRTAMAGDDGEVHYFAGDVRLDGASAGRGTRGMVAAGTSQTPEAHSGE